MRNIDDVVAVANEAAYCKMMSDLEYQDAKELWIESRAEELIKNFNDDRDIVELINKRLDDNCVDDEIYNQFITDACWSQARCEYEKQFKD